MQMSEDQLDGIKRVVTFVVIILGTFALGIVGFAIMWATENY